MAKANVRFLEQDERNKVGGGGGGGGGRWGGMVLEGGGQQESFEEVNGVINVLNKLLTK